MIEKHSDFTLSKKFVADYQHKQPLFGFNGLGEIVYKRSYSRVKEDGLCEEWYETVERVVNGCFNMQRRHLESICRSFDYATAQAEGQKMYEKMFSFKFLPPGRGLWAMGTKLTESKHLYAALNNCAFVSTACKSPEEFIEPFVFLMDLSMLGAGVGFDTKGAHKIDIKAPIMESKQLMMVEDSREGWVNSVKALLESYFYGRSCVEFDYSKIRKPGIWIKGFGGFSSGAEPLKRLHIEIRENLDKEVGRPIGSRTIIDIMNMIGKCLVTGNIRRPAEISFGEPDDEEFLNLKDYKLYPEREAYGWASNNSVFCRLGMDYSKACSVARKNGEPGFCWPENMKAYGRMSDPPNFRDYRASGGNPCLEQTLESYEMCCLVETFPYNHDSYEEFEETLKYALMFAKTVTLGLSHWEKTNEIVKRNRRIGCSISGIAQFLGRRDLPALREWCRKGYDFLQAYDNVISAHFSVNRSIKLTCVKPSGTVSLLAGATPGIHFPESQYYIRRVKFPKSTDLFQLLTKAGYKIEKDAYCNDENALVVEIPVCAGLNIRTVKDVSMWEQMSLAAFLQEHWADNQVSCTVTFDQEREGRHLVKALTYFQYRLKGISFLPKLKPGEKTYVQLPYEEIAEDKYKELVKNIRQICATPQQAGKAVDPAPELFCESDKCVAAFVSQKE